MSSKIIRWVLRLLEPLIPTLSHLTPIPCWNTGFTFKYDSTLRKIRREKWQNAREAFLFRWYRNIRMNAIPGEETSQCLYLEGHYEPNALCALDKILAPGMVFVDAGANCGVYTLFAASKVGSGGKVLAIEPSSREFKKLLDNIRINHLKNIEPCPKALWNRPATLRLQVARAPHTGHNTGGKFAYSHTVLENVEEIQAVDLDSLMEEKKLPRADVIKMDLEGAEGFALEGARKTIEGSRPVILIEILDLALKGFGHDHQKIWDMLTGWGYRFFCYSQTTGLPQEVRDYPGEAFSDFLVCPEEKIKILGLEKGI